MDKSREQLIQECRAALLKAKEERLNGVKSLTNALSSEIKGDEGDIAQSLADQNTAITQREKLLREVREIDLAMARLQEGSYGVCEETEEPIEPARLRAIPWTRLSLAGAEIRERQRKRFA